MRFALQITLVKFILAFKFEIKMKGSWNKNNAWDDFEKRNKIIYKHLDGIEI